MHLKYAKMLAIVEHENMQLGHNTPNNERLKLKGHIKGRLISRTLIFLKNLSSGLKIVR